MSPPNEHENRAYIFKWVPGMKLTEFSNTGLKKGLSTSK